MDNTRPNKRVFLWSDNASNSKVKNWSFKVKSKFAGLDLNHFSIHPMETVLRVPGESSGVN